MKRNDFILIISIITLCIISYLLLYSGDEGNNVEIYVDGDIIATYNLNEDRTVPVDNNRGGLNTVVISNGTVYMEQANCPNKICMDEGHISHDGETICCAPNGIMVIVNSQIRGEYDAITR